MSMMGDKQTRLLSQLYHSRAFGVIYYVLGGRMLKLLVTGSI
jgi:hypothetical protein